MTEAEIRAEARVDQRRDDHRQRLPGGAHQAAPGVDQRDRLGLARAALPAAAHASWPRHFGAGTLKPPVHALGLLEPLSERYLTFLQEKFDAGFTAQGSKSKKAAATASRAKATMASTVAQFGHQFTRLFFLYASPRSSMRRKNHWFPR